MKNLKHLAFILFVVFCLYGCEGCSSNDKKPVTSSGYMDKNEYKPTVDESGEYKTIDGSANQVQYQGSKEQQDDLNAIDDYAKEHPDF